MMGNHKCWITRISGTRPALSYLVLALLLVSTGLAIADVSCPPDPGDFGAATSGSFAVDPCPPDSGEYGTSESGAFSIDACPPDPGDSGSAESSDFPLDNRETTPPDIVISSECGIHWLPYGSCVTVAFSASDLGTGVKSVTGTLNGLPFGSGDEVCVPGHYVLVVTAEDYGGNVSEETCEFDVYRSSSDPFPVYQAAPGRTADPAQRAFAGYAGSTGPDLISAVPGVLAIGSGTKWSNFVRASLFGIPYTIKSTILTKQTPATVQCADVFAARTIRQQGTAGVRTWWPLMYELPGTTWTLKILYGTETAWDDDGSGPNRPAYVHSEEWRWMVDADLPSMSNLLALFHELPFGSDEVPLISDETLYPVLQQKLTDVGARVSSGDAVGAGLLLGEFEMEVQDACIATSPSRPSPVGPGAGIAQTVENPVCCKLLADAEYVGRRLGILQQSR